MAVNNTQLDKVPACFFFASHINKNTSGYTVCKEIENVVGVGNVVGAQYLHGLYRVYLKTMEARKTLLLRGVTINSVFISCIDQNPNIVKGAEEKPAVKLIVGHLPLSVSNEEILTHLKRVDGVNVRTNIFDEKYRDDNGGLTSFKTGRRFVYCDPPVLPLPREFLVGDWKASLWHFGMKDKHSKTEINTDKSEVFPQEKSTNKHTENVSADRPHIDTAKPADLSDTPVTPSASQEPTQSKQHRGSVSVDNTLKSKYFSGFGNCQSRPSRSPTRGRRNGKQRSVSRSRLSDSRKRFSIEHDESPSAKNRSRLTGHVAGSANRTIDYFNFTNDTSEDLL